MGNLIKVDWDEQRQRTSLMQSITKAIHSAYKATRNDHKGWIYYKSFRKRLPIYLSNLIYKWYINEHKAQNGDYVPDKKPKPKINTEAGLGLLLTRWRIRAEQHRMISDNKLVPVEDRMKAGMKAQVYYKVAYELEQALGGSLPNIEKLLNELNEYYKENK